MERSRVWIMLATTGERGSVAWMKDVAVCGADEGRGDAMAVGAARRLVRDASRSKSLESSAALLALVSVVSEIESCISA
jgi:hypothetical protein